MMKHGYIVMAEQLHVLRQIKGRMTQIEGRIGHEDKSITSAAATELAHARTDLDGVMDKLVEVQVMFPEPSKADIVRHFNPDAVDVKGFPTPRSFAAAVQGFKDAKMPVFEGIEETVDDGRPAGWTEALALSFLSDGTDGPEEFAKAFLHGDWPTIQREWPEFQTFVNKQLEGTDAAPPTSNVTTCAKCGAVIPLLHECGRDEHGNEVCVGGCAEPVEEEPQLDEEAPVKEEHYDQWVVGECMMLLNGLDLIDNASIVEVDLPREQIDLLGRVLESERKRITAVLGKKLSKVVLPHVPE